MSKNSDDILFILSEVVRHREMSREERMKLSPGDAFAMLSLPSGGGYMMGGDASRRLYELSRRSINNSQYRGRISANGLFRILNEVIAVRFIQEHRKVTVQQADRAISSALKKSAGNIGDRTYFVPCHLGHEEDPASFSFGRVVFYKREEFYKNIQPVIDEYAKREPVEEDQEGARHTDRWYIERAQEYYDSFGWVVEVPIDGCDAEVARERAKRVAQSAIDCLQLLLGRYYSRYMRAGGESFSYDERGSIYIDKDGRLTAGISKNPKMHYVGESWWEWVTKEGGEYIINLIGVALECGVMSSNPSPLALRFLDAAAWYGEAVRDNFDASRLIKYVTAMERVLITDDESDKAKTVAKRGAALLLGYEGRSYDELYGEFKRVYDARSKAAHGTLSPYTEELARSLYNAEKLARLTLAHVLQVYKEEGLRKEMLSNRELDVTFSKFVDELISGDSIWVQDMGGDKWEYVDTE